MQLVHGAVYHGGIQDPQGTLGGAEERQDEEVPRLQHLGRPQEDPLEGEARFAEEAAPVPGELGRRGVVSQRHSHTFDQAT